jgi:hypothetical protein
MSGPVDAPLRQRWTLAAFRLRLLGGGGEPPMDALNPLFELRFARPS